MENTRDKLNEDADKMIEFGMEHEYLLTAFNDIFGKRIVNQGYVDGSFILATSVRGTYYSQLKGSRLQKLYAKGCVPSENVDIMIEYLTNIVSDPEELTKLEKEALVFWIFLPYLGLLKHGKRKDYLLLILQKVIKYSLSSRRRRVNLAVSHGVIYDKNKCVINIVSSIEEYAGEIFSLKENHTDNMMYYRGHSRLNYLLQPGIKRDRQWLENESIMYQELLVRCAQDFIHCQTHLDYLVEMQHYGLPTRLLDITENPLVALYFACCNNRNDLGEIIVLCTNPVNVKYAKSDTVALLSALPTLSYDEQENLYQMCINGILERDDEEYRKLAGKLAAEVKSRNPAFEPRIRKDDLLGHVFVIPVRNNQRIMKQEGSFIVCGLDGEYDEDYFLDSLRCRDDKDKKIIFVVEKKSKILEELDVLSINRASLFPEIDDVAEYIREKYRKVGKDRGEET